MRGVERNVAIKYALEYQDRGLSKAVAATRSLEQASQKSGAAAVFAARRQQDAWRAAERDAIGLDRQATRRAVSQSTAVSRSVGVQVDALHRLGASYKEISQVMRASGASANQAAMAIERQASREEAAAKRIEAARRTLSRAATNAIGITGGGHRGIGRPEERSFMRGTVRGAVDRGGSFLGGGMLGGLAGFVSVQGIKDAIKSTQELALATRNLHTLTGMDTQTAAEWVSITNARGISTRTFGVSLKQLSLQTTNAMNGSKASVKVFEDLGISYADVKKHSGNLSEMLGLVADHLNKMPGGTEKTAIAGKLLGRNFMALLPILSEGSKKMAQQREEAKAMGVQLGGNSAENAKKLEEAQVKLKIAQEGLSIQFTEHLAPALISGTTKAIGLAVAVGHELSPAFKFLSPVVKDVGHWLSENKGIVIGLVGAFAALKVVRTVGGWFQGLYNDGRKGR